MGRRNIDEFEELGYEMEVVSGGIQELAVLYNLIYSMLEQGNTTENTGNEPPVTRSLAFLVQQRLPLHSQRL